MCERARIAIFTAFSKRVQKPKTTLAPLVTANDLWSRMFVGNIRRQFPNAEVNAHKIEDLSAELIESWGGVIASGEFDVAHFEDALAEELADKHAVISIRGPQVDQAALLSLIRETKFAGKSSIGQLLKAFADRTQFHEPEDETQYGDVVTLSEECRGELDAAGVVNGAATGVDDPDLCG
ncbi:MAG: hypothetical protein HQ564_05685 [Candidatus Saganbacteria bacterium]|nr:hypothetical protein [Candidatus Saganbacteria bacterium]